MTRGRKFVIENHPFIFHICLKGLELLSLRSYSSEKNHDLWSKVVRAALKSKNKLGFIDGTLAKPTPKAGEDQSKLEAWEMVNSMICSWIINVINLKLHTSVTYAKTA